MLFFLVNLLILLLLNIDETDGTDGVGKVGCTGDGGDLRAGVPAAGHHGHPQRQVRTQGQELLRLLRQEQLRQAPQRQGVSVYLARETPF